MNLRLTIEGSASQLAMILASLPDGVAVDAASPGINNPAPIVQASLVPAMPTGQPVDDEGDDNGPVNANAPSVDSSGLAWDERIHSGTKTTKGDGTWTGKRGGPKGAEYDAIVAELRARSSQPTPSPQPAPAPVMQPTPMPAPQPMPPMPIPNAAPVPHAVAPMPSPVPAPVGTEFGAGGAAPAYSPPPMPQPVPPMPEQAAQPQPVPMPAPQPMAQPAPAPEPMQTAVAAASGTLDFAQFMQHLSGQMTKRDGNGAPLVHADYLAGITAEISQAFGQQLSAITDIASNPPMITYAMQCMQRDGRW